jgi:uncharacterized membrane protein
VARTLAVAALCWVAAIGAAPLALRSSSPLVSFTAAGIYAAGSRVCHQRPERSFRIGGGPMPVCARCTGLYLSAAAAAPLALLLAGPLAVRRARVMVLLASLPTLLTWGAEVAGLAHPSNLSRAAAAVPLGAAAAWLVIGILRDGMPRRATRS